MISESLKKPPTAKVSPHDVKQLKYFINNTPPIIEENGVLQLQLSRKQWDLVCNVINSFCWITELLPIRRAGIHLIRKVLNIPLLKKTSNNEGDKENLEDTTSDEGDKENSEDTTSDKGDKENSEDTTSDKGDKENSEDITSDKGEEEGDIEEDSSDKKKDTETSSSDSSNEEQEDPSQKGPMPRPTHNGRRGEDDLLGALIFDHYHPYLRPKDYCPTLDCPGRVYDFNRDGQVATVITFDFTPPFTPLVHKLHHLRCNTCLTVYKAVLPEELIKNGALEKGRYLYPVKAALAILHYGLGMPFRRLDLFHSLVGDRFPEATQFDLMEELANFFQPIIRLFKQSAANGYMIQGDDVANKILELHPEIKKNQKGSLAYREGIHTSIMIATTNEGDLVPVLQTGIIHFGELLDQILEKRSPGLFPPLVVCDGSKVNQTKFPALIGGCWEHAQEYFYKAYKSFPEETIEFKNLFKLIFEKDRETHEMTAEERLLHLQTEALPLVEKIKEIVEQQRRDQIALPKSELGTALDYFHNQYKTLLLPFKYPGVPIHNNISEWCTYLVMRYLANSRFYKNEIGAAIGDIIMSIILACYLSHINPYHYIIYCLQHREDLQSSPENYLPWKLKGIVEKAPDHNKMKFWTPPPPLTRDVSTAEANEWPEGHLPEEVVEYAPS